MAIDFPEVTGYFTGRFDQATGYPVFINFEGSAGTQVNRTIGKVNIDGSDVRYIL